MRNRRNGKGPTLFALGLMTGAFWVAIWYWAHPNVIEDHQNVVVLCNANRPAVFLKPGATFSCDPSVKHLSGALQVIELR